MGKEITAKSLNILLVLNLNLYVNYSYRQVSHLNFLSQILLGNIR